MDEDYVEYVIHCLDDTYDVHKLRDDVMKFTGESLTDNYLWQRDEFQLSCRNSNSLYGRTVYGDNIDDEWFIVYILHRITAKFPRIVATVTDQDGQFLLVESALHIPDFLQPENSDNRVFIISGKIHIITKKQSSSIGLNEALSLLRNDFDEFKASSSVVKCVEKRMSGFPEKLFQRNNFFVKCFVPRRVAQILASDPFLIAFAVNTFYTRTPLLSKKTSFMRHFPPEDMLWVRVRFSECLFSQISFQEFFPPKSYRFVIPEEESEKYKGCVLGMKLSCAFEMIFVQSNDEDRLKIEEKMRSGFIEEKTFDELGEDSVCSIEKSPTLPFSDEDMGDMVGHMKNFLETLSSHEGAQFFGESEDEEENEDNCSVDNDVIELMKEMDRELNHEEEGEFEHGMEEDKIVDVSGLNIMRSYESQGGESGPIGNIIGRIHETSKDD